MENPKEPIPSPFMAVKKDNVFENSNPALEITRREFHSNPTKIVPGCDLTPGKVEVIRQMLGVKKILIVTQRDDAPMIDGTEHKVSMGSIGFSPEESLNVLEVVKKALPH